MHGGLLRGALADSHGTYRVCRKSLRPLRIGRTQDERKGHSGFSEFLLLPDRHTALAMRHTIHRPVRLLVRRFPFPYGFFRLRCPQGSSNGCTLSLNQTTSEFQACHWDGSCRGYGILWNYRPQSNGAADWPADSHRSAVLVGRAKVKNRQTVVHPCSSRPLHSFAQSEHELCRYSRQWILLYFCLFWRYPQ